MLTVNKHSHKIKIKKEKQKHNKILESMAPVWQVIIQTDGYHSTLHTILEDVLQQRSTTAYGIIYESSLQVSLKANTGSPINEDIAAA